MALAAAKRDDARTELLAFAVLARDAERPGLPEYHKLVPVLPTLLRKGRRVMAVRISVSAYIWPMSLSCAKRDFQRREGIRKLYRDAVIRTEARFMQ